MVWELVPSAVMALANPGDVSIECYQQTWNNGVGKVGSQDKKFQKKWYNVLGDSHERIYKRKVVSSIYLQMPALLVCMSSTLRCLISSSSNIWGSRSSGIAELKPLIPI